MKLYIAGPMTGYEDHNFPAFNTAAAQLVAAGYTVENPADTGVVSGWTWADYLRHDLPLMLACDGLALLPGWEQSKGATLEHFVASQVGLPAWPLDWWLNRS